MPPRLIGQLAANAVTTPEMISVPQFLFGSLIGQIFGMGSVNRAQQSSAYIETDKLPQGVDSSQGLAQRCSYGSGFDGLGRPENAVKQVDSECWIPDCDLA